MCVYRIEIVMTYFSGAEEATEKACYTNTEIFDGADG